MHSLWFTKSFWDFSNFFKLNRGEPSLWGEPILKKVWIIWYPILYFNFKSFKDPNYSSSIRFQCILLNWRVPFSDFWKLPQIKEGDLISWGGVWGTNSAERLNYLVPLLYLNFKSFKDPKSFLFLRFQCILHNYGILPNTFQMSTN